MKENKLKTLVISFIVFFSLCYYIGLHIDLLMQNGDFSYVTSNLFESLVKPFNVSYVFIPQVARHAGVVSFITSVILVGRDREITERRINSEKGSAKWNNDIKKYKKGYVSEEYKDNAILSDDVFLSMDTRKTQRNLNIMVVGGSGSGKTRFFIKPNLLQANCSFVITDPSGEILETTGKFLEKEGYKVKVFNVKDLDKSSFYNPFKYAKTENGILNMIDVFMKNTTPAESATTDPFFENAEKALLQAICFYLFYAGKEEERNFSNVSRLVELGRLDSEDSDVPTPLDIIFEEFKVNFGENNVALKQYNVFKQAAGKTAMSILVSAAVRLAPFNLEDIGNLTSTDTLDLDNLSKEKTAVFCIMDVTDKTRNFLLAIMFEQMFNSLYRTAEENSNKRLKHHTRFLLDEFANIGTIPNFGEKLATMRKYEISCSIILQDLFQLENLYKKSWKSIIGNCDSFVFLGGQETNTLEYLNKKLGKETIRIGGGSVSNKDGSFSDKTFSKNTNIADRDLLTIDELSGLDNMKTIVFVRGLNPFFSNKFKLEKHPNFKKSADSSKENTFDIVEYFENLKEKEKDSPKTNEEEEFCLNIVTEKEKIEDIQTPLIEELIIKTEEGEDEETGLKDDLEFLNANLFEEF